MKKTQLHKTRYPGLLYTCEAFAQWTFIAAETKAPIGPKYASMSELLADVERFATERGYTGEEAKPSPSSTVERTPGIWRRASTEIGDEYSTNILAEDGSIITRCQPNVYFDWEQQEANAAYICKAVNLHEELIEVLENVVWNFEGTLSERSPIQKKAIEYAKAILQKAKG